MALLDGMLHMPRAQQTQRYALGTHLLEQVVAGYRGGGACVHSPEVFYRSARRFQRALVSSAPQAGSGLGAHIRRRAWALVCLGAHPPHRAAHRSQYVRTTNAGSS